MAARIASGGPDSAFLSDDIEVVYQISLAPSGLTCSPDGHWILSLNQTEKPRARVVSVNKTGKVDPFPSLGMSEALPDEPLPLDAVEGMQLDSNGVVWLLDNGRRSEMSPKVVGWQPDKNRLVSVHHIGQPAAVPGSFFSDLAVDPDSPFIYISDPASGSDAAIVALDRSTGLTRRLLQGHPSVVPDATVPMPLAAIGSSTRRLDGVQTLPHSGADPIALDRKGEWLYFAPLRSSKLYRIRTEFLRSPDLNREKLASHVEVYADKPPTSSISLDNKGNVYLGDLGARAIGVIEENTRKYRILVSDPRLVSPNGLCFGTDGKLYFFSRSQFAGPESLSAKTATVSVTSTATAEHSLYRMKPLSSGRAGD